MKLLTVAPYFLIVTSVLCVGCCQPLRFVKTPTYSAKSSGFEATTPVDDDDEPECALCAGLGVDVSTDAAVVEVGFVADGLLSNGLGAEANLDIGQGSGDDGGGDYDPNDFLGKTAGYGSDYKVLWARLHARYPIPLGDNPDLKFVPIAGVGYYRWSESGCEDPFDAGFCDPYTTTTLDVGGELMWKQFGLKLILPIGDGPDLSMRVRYHLPVGR